MKRIDQLNIFRFVSSILIVIFHYGMYIYPFTIEPWLRIPRGGQYVLGFFFVLSGFVMAYVYYSQALRGIRWKVFMVNRLSRFLPLYWVALTVMVVLRFGESPNPVVATILEYSLLHAWFPVYALGFNGPGWAMSVFVAFYFVFPYLYTKMLRIGLKRSLYFVFVFWFLSQVTIHLFENFWNAGEHSFANGFLMYDPIVHLNSFMVGVVGGMAFRARGQEKPVNQKRNLVVLLSSLLLMAVFVFLRMDLQEVIPFHIWYSHGLLAPFYLVIILSLAKDETWFSQALGSRWLVRLGDLSFSIYLLQSPVYRLFNLYLLPRLQYHFAWSEALYFYLYLLVLIAAAGFSRYIFEIPAQKFIRKKLLPTS